MNNRKKRDIVKSVDLMEKVLPPSFSIRYQHQGKISEIPLHMYLDIIKGATQEQLCGVLELCGVDYEEYAPGIIPDPHTAEWLAEEIKKRTERKK